MQNYNEGSSSGVMETINEEAGCEVREGRNGRFVVTFNEESAVSFGNTGINLRGVCLGEAGVHPDALGGIYVSVEHMLNYGGNGEPYNCVELCKIKDSLPENVKGYKATCNGGRTPVSFGELDASVSPPNISRNGASGRQEVTLTVDFKDGSKETYLISGTVSEQEAIVVEKW